MPEPVFSSRPWTIAGAGDCTIPTAVAESSQRQPAGNRLSCCLLAPLFFLLVSSSSLSSSSLVPPYLLYVPRCSLINLQLSCAASLLGPYLIILLCPELQVLRTRTIPCPYQNHTILYPYVRQSHPYPDETSPASKPARREPSDTRKNPGRRPPLINSGPRKIWLSYPTPKLSNIHSSPRPSFPLSALSSVALQSFVCPYLLLLHASSCTTLGASFWSNWLL